MHRIITVETYTKIFVKSYLKQLIVPPE